MSELDFEASFWGDCCNTFDEEQKHYVYARYMGLPRVGYAFDAGGRSVIDIGGGPVSMLLKTINRVGSHPAAGTRACCVTDPLMPRYPQWVHARYSAANITYANWRGEDIPVRTLAINPYDEAWIYNVLQHTEDPALIIKNAIDVAKTLRIFEWIDIPPHEGHPHMLTSAKLRAWIEAAGGSPSMTFGTNTLNESGCVGRAFWGVFSRA